MENILITAIGSFAADITIKNLKKNNYRVIGCDIYEKRWIVDAYNVDEFYQAPYVSEKEVYISFIKDICLKENIKFIIPLTDIEVDILNLYREWFINNNIVLCISSKKVIELCRDKNKLSKFINEKNNIIKTIPTTLLKDVEENNLCYPIVCKPINGRSSQGLKYIYNIDDWFNFKRNVIQENFIVQPYIEGSIITVDIIRSSIKNKVVTIGRKELLRTLNGAGTSIHIFKDDKLQCQCVELANLLDVIGCVNFEFIQTESGEYYFIECNPRFSGGIEFSCIAGYDCVINHLNVFLDNDINDLHEIKNQYIVKKYEEYVTEIEE
ncbi:MAG: ATP-grasp domain-containing protein [Clostridia bacterium]